MNRLLLLIFLALFGCNSSKSDESLNTLKESFWNLKQKIDNLTPDTSKITDSTTDEIAKIFKFEYRVISIPSDTDPEKIEMVLQAAGSERWDCFSSQHYGAKLSFYCKRFPHTYLRYVPRFF